MKNVHLIVKFHEGGFFSNFNKVTTFLNNTTDRVVKITWDLQGQPWGAFAYSCGEVFGKLFDIYDLGERVDNDIYLHTYTDTSFTGKEVASKYKDIEWRNKFNNTLKYFKPLPLLEKHIQEVDKIVYNKKIIGILKRNELLKCEQPDGNMPDLEIYFNQIDELIDDNTYLYLSVDNLYDVNAFISRYKKCIYNPKCRRSNTCSDQEPHFIPGNIMDALYTYLEVYSLSKCTHFIHPVSNMATAVLYHNPTIKSIFL